MAEITVDGSPTIRLTNGLTIMRMGDQFYQMIPPTRGFIGLQDPVIIELASLAFDLEARLNAEKLADIKIASACLQTGVVPNDVEGTVEAVQAVCRAFKERQ